MERLTYLMAQQPIQEPPVQLMGSSQGNIIRLNLVPALDIQDYVCSVSAVSFGLSNVEMNITPDNNTIDFDLGAGLITLNIQPGIYEVADIAQILNDQTSGAITIALNPNTSQIDINVSSGVTLYETPLFTNQGAGMFLGFQSLDFPIVGPATAISSITPYVTKYNMIYCQCSIVEPDTRIVYNNITLNRPIVFSTSLVPYKPFDYVYMINFNQQMRSRVLAPINQITQVEFRLIHEDGSDVIYLPGQNSDFNVHVLLNFEKYRMNKIRQL